MPEFRNLKIKLHLVLESTVRFQKILSHLKKFMFSNAQTYGHSCYAKINPRTVASKSTQTKKLKKIEIKETLKLTIEKYHRSVKCDDSQQQTKRWQRGKAVRGEMGLMEKKRGTAFFYACASETRGE